MFPFFPFFSYLALVSRFPCGHEPTLSVPPFAQYFLSFSPGPNFSFSLFYVQQEYTPGPMGLKRFPPRTFSLVQSPLWLCALLASSFFQKINPLPHRKKLFFCVFFFFLLVSHGFSLFSVMERRAPHLSSFPFSFYPPHRLFFLPSAPEHRPPFFLFVDAFQTVVSFRPLLRFPPPLFLFFFFFGIPFPPPAGHLKGRVPLSFFLKTFFPFRPLLPDVSISLPPMMVGGDTFSFFRMDKRQYLFLLSNLPFLLPLTFASIISEGSHSPPFFASGKYASRTFRQGQLIVFPYPS